MLNWVALIFVAVFRDICCFTVDNRNYLPKKIRAAKIILNNFNLYENYLKLYEII